jgi:hypothetical protein
LRNGVMSATSDPFSMDDPHRFPSMKATIGQAEPPGNNSQK